MKQWITLNEPFVTSVMGYGKGVFAPGIVQPGVGDYLSAHNQIRAHARAYRLDSCYIVYILILCAINHNYRLYHKEFAETQEGQVGITLNTDWFEPEDFQNSSHVEASETMLQFWFGWFANPILINGKYPEIMRQKVSKLRCDYLSRHCRLLLSG